ncbi:MAG: molybdopterin-dependent oxidoreductase [Rhodothermaceae bacterium]|nr:molybdopterin-dependent oxidoreductase [Rhodothermaceae bacterium]
MSEHNKLNRREFLKSSALLGGTTLLAGSAFSGCSIFERAENNDLTPEEFYELCKPENILYTTCMNCNTGCAIKTKFVDGVLVKVDGNPFSPWTMTPHIDYKHDPTKPEIAKLDGAICPKGQAGIQILYDPYRIRKVLKRTGKRGEGKFKSIPFDQAVKEIVDGGRIFADVPGEESRNVDGLNEIYKLRDRDLGNRMGADVENIKNGTMSVAQFKEKYRNNLDVLIDPDHPDLGPKNNQLVFNWGRMKAGRSQFVQRFINQSFGTNNRHGHTTVCQGSLYFACKAMSEQYTNGKWGGGQKFYWQADTGNSEFIIFVGSNAFEGGYGPPLRTSKITNGLTERSLKFAVVDPRLGKLGGMAWKWIPAEPGTEAALALAMTRWIIDNGRYDKTYLSATNKPASDQVGEPNWSNAAWLVKIDSEGRPGDFLRASEIGLGGDRFVALQNGRATALSPREGAAVFGDLLVDTILNGIRVKSSIQLLKESAEEHTIREWADICGIRERDIVDLAREFTSHGKKAAADIHRGVSQHTNGYYGVSAWMNLNLLIGNIGWKGGMSQPSTYGATSGAYPVMSMHSDPASPFGTSIIRHDEHYEKSTLFNGYPARRPWYPLASDIYQEVIPSIGDAYPYPVKALILYMGAPNYSLPAGDKLNEILSDTEKLPLFISNDITIGATSLYADYIFPDGTYFERWEFHGSHPNVTSKVQPVRTPVITPLVDTCNVYGEEMPMTLESMLMGFAENLDLPGFGPDGFGPGQKLTHFDHFYLKMAANIAAQDGGLPEASDEEMRIFRESRRHIAGHTFDEKRWSDSAGERWWKQVVYMLNRGGRFQGYDDSYNGEKLANAYDRQVNIYHEKTARSTNSMTGLPIPGIARHSIPSDSLGRPLQDKEMGYNLRLNTFRQGVQTKSRTNVAYWLLAIHPTNYILINRITANELGYSDGDMVKLTSLTNPDGIWDLGAQGKRPVAGKLKVIEGIRPGTVMFSLGFGQWANGASDMVVDGQVIKKDDRRGRGIHANAVMGIDPHLKNTCLTDPVGASAVFYDTHVKLEAFEGELV